MQHTGTFDFVQRYSFASCTVFGQVISSTSGVFPRNIASFEDALLSWNASMLFTVNLMLLIDLRV